MTHLIDDLLDVTRITTNRVQLRLKAIDAGLLVNRAVDSARPITEERHHRLALHISDQEMPLYVDPTRVEKVIVNLLTNAGKYTPEGGDISVKTCLKNEQVVIEVRDTGVGIPREMLTRVFDLFTQVEPTLDRAKGGLGIGLTVARHLTEMHGGTVSVKSEGLGKGSEFSVHLPLSAVRVDTVTPAAAAPTIQPGLRVLIIDDNIDTAQMLGLLLQRLRCVTRELHDRIEAVDVAKSFRPDIILLDIGLPGIDGYQVAKLVRNSPEISHVLLIALTGYGQRQDRERARDAGFDDHLVKPVEFDALVEAMATKHGQAASLG